MIDYGLTFPFKPVTREKIRKLINKKKSVESTVNKGIL